MKKIFLILFLLFFPIFALDPPNYSFVTVDYFYTLPKESFGLGLSIGENWNKILIGGFYFSCSGKPNIESDLWSKQYDNNIGLTIKENISTYSNEYLLLTYGLIFNINSFIHFKTGISHCEKRYINIF